MAILACVPGIEVAIRCNNTQLQEYPDRSGDGVNPAVEPKTVTNYIESTADAEFSIKFSVMPPFNLGRKDLGFFVTMDGKTDDSGYLCIRKDLDKSGGWNLEVRGLENKNKARAVERAFIFANLLLTEDSISCMSENAIEAMKKVGLIEVKVFRLTIGRTAKYKPPRLEGFKEIPEKAIKGQSISHSIAYGDEKFLPIPSTYMDIGKTPGQDDYIAMFRFKYRSREDLQREMIMTMTSPLEQAILRDINTLTVDEKRRLARMQFEDMEMLRSLTGSNASLSDSHRFGDLDENKINLLAKKKYEQMTKNAIIKPESEVKREAIDQITKEMSQHINPIARSYKVVEIGNGRMAIDLDDESETVHLESSHAPTEV